jgi:hypothetical protein
MAVDLVEQYKQVEEKLNQAIGEGGDSNAKATLLREMDSLLESMTEEERDSVMPTRKLLTAVTHRE